MTDATVDSPAGGSRGTIVPGNGGAPSGTTDKTKILIVDDLPEKFMVFESILEELGQTLVFASSGAEALKLVLREEFAVILLDVNMPGMDGFEAASLIRSRRRISISSTKTRTFARRISGTTGVGM